MAKKNNTSLYAGIAVAVIVVVAIIIGVVIANKNKSGGEPGQSEGGSSQSVPQYSTIDETVTYGDYDSMEILSKKIQNGEMVGKVVKVEGLVSHPMSTFSVVEPNEDGSQKIGTKFVITGADEADYPKDGDRIVITGEIIEESPMVFIIKTYPQYIKVQ